MRHVIALPRRGSARIVILLGAIVTLGCAEGSGVAEGRHGKAGSSGAAPTEGDAGLGGGSSSGDGGLGSASACTPATCAELAAECGTVPDQCGRELQCGACAPGETCGGGGKPNVCGSGPCAPKSCAAQGKTCGTISDGCGSALDCGQCSAPETCGGAGTSNVCGGGCAAGKTSCDGVCVDLKSSSEHCGACGHDCCGGSCLGGACQPVVLAAGEKWPYWIVVDEQAVYWTNQATAPNGAIRKLSKSGGTPTTVLGGLEMPSVLAADATRLFLATANGHSIVSVTKGGSGFVTLTNAEAAIYGLAADESNVYWTFGQPGSGKVKKIAKSGSGSSVELANGQNTPYGLALDSTHVYFATWNGETVMRVPKSGGPAQQLWFGGNANGAGPQYITADAADVYVTDAANGGGVRRVAKNGSGASVAAWPASGKIWNSFGITADSKSVYFANSSEDSIRKIDKATGAVSIVAHDFNPDGVAPWAIAVDENCVYWTNAGGTGTVMKTGK